MNIGTKRHGIAILANNIAKRFRIRSGYGKNRQNLQNPDTVL